LKSSSQDPRVFVSYARSDGEAFACQLRERLEREGIPLWRDREGMEGGRDWWLQIAEALDKVEFMVLVMTPAAMASAVVRKEWRHARQKGVAVYPVIGAANLDFAALPRWMRDANFYDLDHSWQKFVNDLNTRYEQPRVPFMAEDMPIDFVPRPEELEQLIAHLLDGQREEPIALTAALKGAGGYGKTALARALCHQEDIQNAFDDGILWVTLGETPGDLTPKVEDLIYTLSGERPGFSSVDAATTRLVELLADRELLIVIDDVWNNAHIKPFTQGGPRCARLITTRNADTLPPNSKRVEVDAMRKEEAIALVGYALPCGHVEEFRRLATRMGEWPLLLKLANGALRERVQVTGQSLADALAFVNKALDRKGLTFFDARDAVARHQAVSKTLDISIGLLSDAERTRYAELAVFPEGVDIPMATLEKFWGRTGGLDDFDTESLCDRLSRLSLLLTFDPNGRYIRLHDVIRRFLTDRLSDGMTALHRQLLDAHSTGGSWGNLPQGEPYLWDFLAYHLKGAGRGAELVEAAKDLHYLAAKALLRTALAVEADLIAAEEFAPADAALSLLRRSFVKSGHVLNRCENLRELESTLYTRLQHLPDLAEIIARFAKSLSLPHLAVWHALPDLPHPALIRTLSGHSGTVWGCAISPDGSFIVSAAYERVLKVWDAKTWRERLTLSGHAGWISSCAVSPDGSFIVSASHDRTVRIWDAATGDLRRVLAGHTDGVTDCAVSPDGSFLVSASLDGALRVWDTQSGSRRHVLAVRWMEEDDAPLRPVSPGHWAAVHACAVSPDGRLIVSGSSDQTLKIWDALTGAEIATLTGHTAAVKDCAFSPDGGFVVSASADRTLRLWRAGSWTEHAVLTGHTRAVNACVFSPDSACIVSASTDGTLKLWDAVDGAECLSLSGHTDWVNDCAVLPDGSCVVSCSSDGSLKIWDARHRAGALRLTGHGGLVNGCACSPDGNYLVSASSDRALKIWDAATGVVRHSLWGHGDSVKACAVSSDGRIIVSASADKSLKTWDAESGTELFAFLGHKDWVRSCAISPDGSFVVSASDDGTLRVWDAKTGNRLLTFAKHRDSVSTCAISSDGALLVSAGADGILKIWDLKIAHELWAPSGFVERPVSLPYGQSVLEPIALHGHTDRINHCAIAPDNAFIVSAADDATLRVWDVKTRSARLLLAGHRDWVNGCAISADSSKIASVSEDQTLRVWSATGGECLTSLKVDGALSDCAWFPDNQRIAAVGAGGVYFLRLVG
jgi:WD40 repeat protein